jgi:hypothetical protein
MYMVMSEPGHCNLQGNLGRRGEHKKSKKEHQEKMFVHIIVILKYPDKDMSKVKSEKRKAHSKTENAFDFSPFTFHVSLFTLHSPLFTLHYFPFTS